MSETLTSAADILAIEDRKKFVRVHVKAWKREVLLRDPSVADRDEWEIYATVNKGQPVAWRAKVAQLLLCDEEGKRLFSEKDIPKLADKSAAAIHEIWDVGVKLFDVTEEDLDELEKNSDASR